MNEAKTTLDPVTLEVLKNSFITTVDQMAEQVLRTCYSFVIYNRDFSSVLCDANGDVVAQGNQDLAAHVGTLHYTCKAVIDYFGDDVHPGDIFMINDPYAGGTHFNDVRVLRPIFAGDRLIAYAQSNGHWADIGGSAPGSFDMHAKEMFREGVRITPVRICDEGRFRDDVVDMIAANTRDPASVVGDCKAQTEATGVAEREIHRLVEKYGVETVVAGMAEVQDYVERAARNQIAALPDGTWEAVDYLDSDPTGNPDQLIAVKVKLTIAGDSLTYDFTGSHATIGNLYNSAFGGTFSGIISGMKYFLPDVPLNSGFYRPISVKMEPNSIVDARWPVAVTGFVDVFEKIMNAVFKLWSDLVPERAMACTFNLEYFLTGGNDGRLEGKPIFMFYDWLPGGWGGRNGKDGCNVTASVFGTGLQSQPIEGQERLSPIITEAYQILTDSAGPGEFRGGVGAMKIGRYTETEKTVLSYICDRERSVVWGINGGLPSIPHGMWVRSGVDGSRQWHGALFSDLAVSPGDAFGRSTAGGGGYGDPLNRDPEAVMFDVEEDYVSVERAARDYGVILKVVDQDLAEYEIDYETTRAERDQIAAAREGWVGEDAESVAARYRDGELDDMDLVRRYGVILDWGTGELLPTTTEQYREMFATRIVPYWTYGGP